MKPDLISSLTLKEAQNSDKKIQTTIPFKRDISRCLPSSPNNALIDFINSGPFPFNILSNISFRNLITTAQNDPAWKLATRQHAATTLLDKGYEEALEESIELVNSCEYVAVSTDGSTGAKDQSYWTLTLHGVNSNCELVSSLLACFPVYKSHSAVNIAEDIRPFFKKVGLTERKLSCYTTDEGGSAPCIHDHFNCECIHCAAHLLQTVIKRALKEVTASDPVIAVIIDCSKRTISLFRGSTERRKQLNSLQRQHDTPIVALVKDVATRFNTTYFALKSVLDNKMPILNWINNHEKEADDAQVRLLDANKTVYWSILHEIVSLLEPFEQATRKLSQDKVPTLNLVIPEFMKLKSTLINLKSSLKLKPCINLADGLLEELDKKFLPWNKFELFALYLSPDFHKLSHLSDVLSTASQKLNAQLIDVEPIPTNKSTSSRSTPTVIDEYRVLGAGASMDVDAPSSSSNSSENLLHKELQLYQTIVSSLPPGTPLLDFWRTQRAILPQLYGWACKVLGIPASQTPSERVFSLMRLIFHHLRGNLDPETVNKVITHSFFVRRRNLALLEARKQVRSQKSVDADAQRRHSTDATTRQKAQAREGDYTELIDHPTPSIGSTEDDIIQDQIDYLTLMEESFGDMDDGERKDDDDYVPEDLEAGDDQDIGPPPPKRAKRKEESLEVQNTITQANLYACSVNKNLIIGIFNADWRNSPPSLEQIFGRNHIYLEDFKLVDPDTSRRSFSVQLSSAGKKKFKTGRRGALSQLGEIQHLDLSAE